MDTAVLVVHSLCRWLVLFLGFGALYRALTGLARTRKGGEPEIRWERLFLIALDVQVVLGLLLYFFLSRFTQAALADMGGAMRSPELRFWAVEHALVMAVAAIVGHVGLFIAKRTAREGRASGAGTICLVVALLLVVVGIPWPFRRVGRPLWPHASVGAGPRVAWVAAPPAMGSSGEAAIQAS